MGRGRGKSKSKKRLNLSEAKFGNKICKRCRICNGPAKSFCYSKYKESPADFLREAVPQLTALSGWPDAGPHTLPKEYELFSCIFCDSVCKKMENNKKGYCKLLDDCFNRFEGQVMTARLDLVCAYSNTYLSGKKKNLGNNKQKRKKNKQKNKHKKTYTKLAAVPKFFSNDDAEWEIIIEKVFNAHTDSEQNKDNQSDESAT